MLVSWFSLDEHPLHTVSVWSEQCDNDAGAEATAVVEVEAVAITDPVDGSFESTTADWLRLWDVVCC